jgi:hypothetical protein
LLMQALFLFLRDFQNMCSLGTNNFGGLSWQQFRK